MPWREPVRPWGEPQEVVRLHASMCWLCVCDDLATYTANDARSAPEAAAMHEYFRNACQ